MEKIQQVKHAEGILKNVCFIPMNTKGLYEETISKKIFMDNNRYYKKTRKLVI